MATRRDRIDRFLAHLDEIFGVEPTFFPLDSSHPNVPGVVCLVYRDIPEAGFITGVTYGLSEVQHPTWKLGRPELTITVDSEDLAWPLAMAHMANNLRGNCPFCYGDVVNFGAQISDESEMSAFLIFAPSIFEEKQSYLNIDVGGEQLLNISGVYPLYDSEREVIPKIGLKAFWHHPNFGMYDVKRRRVEAS
jgi:hypothetical protein